MQVGVGFQPGQRLRHGRAHAMLVDEPHVKHLQPDLLHQAFFTLVHAADADLAHPGRVNGWPLPGQAGQAIGPVAAQAGHRHAVQVAARGQGLGVEVGMGIEPQHAQPLARVAAVARHRADRADGQAVVAAQQQRQLPYLQRGQHGVVHRLVPGCHLGQVAVAVHRRLPGVGRAAQVALVVHLQAQRRQHRRQLRHPQRLRPHAGAAAAGADVGRRANQADRAAHGGRLRPRVAVGTPAAAPPQSGSAR